MIRMERAFERLQVIEIFLGAAARLIRLGVGDVLSAFLICSAICGIELGDRDRHLGEHGQALRIDLGKAAAHENTLALACRASL